MGRVPGMTLERRHQAIGMLDAGMLVNDVAGHFGVHRSTIHRLRTRYAASGDVSDRRRSGRPKKTTQRQDNYVVTSSRRNRFDNSVSIANTLRNATGVRVHARTVRNRLRTSGIRAYRPYVGVPLSPRHRQDRLNWTRAHQRWTRRQWNEVLFTDESRFNVDFNDGRRRVWRRRGERLHPQNVAQHDRYGRGSVMIWVGICDNRKTDLVEVPRRLTAIRYCNEIVQPVIVPFLQQGHARILQQDNARPHVARHTITVLQRNNIATLDWPAKSPDLSPIEHFWDVLGRKVRRRQQPIV